MYSMIPLIASVCVHAFVAIGGIGAVIIRVVIIVVQVKYDDFIKLDVGMPARRPPDHVLRRVEELDREMGLGAELRRQVLIIVLEL